MGHVWILSLLFTRLVMYGNDEPPPPKKGKKSKSKSRRDKKELDDELLAKLPPAYPTTDVSHVWLKPHLACA